MKNKFYKLQVTPKIKKEIRKLLFKKNSLSKITVGWPVFDEKEILGALDSLLNIRITQGPKVEYFEKMFAKYLGKKFAVAVNSGTSANILALDTLIHAHGIPRGSEVILPAATFSSVASPVLQLGLKPVYVDVDHVFYNIDPAEVEKAISKKTRIIIVVHSLGNPADIQKILGIAKKHKLLVLEDCCEAHGARLGKKMVGSFGDIATLSFFVAHNITTGEGGMVFTNQAKYRDLLLSLREFGRLPSQQYDNKRSRYKDKVLGYYDTRYVFKYLGYNFRMTDIEAAMGIEQLKKLDRLNKKRLKIVRAYDRGLKKFERWLQLPTTARGAYHTFYGYSIIIKRNAPFTRKEITLFLEQNSIETRPFFAGCLPDQPGFRNQPKRVVGALPVARWIRDNAIFIGCHPALSREQVKKVIRTFEDFFNERKT